MKLSNIQIATSFSTGQFADTFPYLADNIIWNIAGERLLDGKPAVTEFCNQTAKYFSEVTTEFKISNTINSDNYIAIEGTATFINKANKKTFVSSCDIYHFENDSLKQINSYCIMENK